MACYTVSNSTKSLPKLKKKIKASATCLGTPENKIATFLTLYGRDGQILLLTSFLECSGLALSQIIMPKTFGYLKSLGKFLMRKMGLFFNRNLFGG